jgi:multiple sugar transport system substrate-binding protein
VVGAGLGACSSSSSSGPAGAGSPSGAAGGTYTIWDPYPQFTQGSAWTTLLSKCGQAAGVTVKRTAFDTTALTSKVLLAAQQGAPPDVLIVDNPVVSTLAQAGV